METCNLSPHAAENLIRKMDDLESRIAKLELNEQKSEEKTINNQIYPHKRRSKKSQNYVEFCSFHFYDADLANRRKKQQSFSPPGFSTVATRRKASSAMTTTAVPSPRSTTISHPTARFTRY